MPIITIEQITPSLAKEICRGISATLPEWFGIPEANARYEHGMLEQISFAAKQNDEYIGLITLEFPYPNNANIYWMAVKKNFHRQKIGTRLLQMAENYCFQNGYSSLTVETLSAKQQEEHYLKTYHFYENSGFKSLFEMHTYDSQNLMVYMHKLLNFELFNFIDLTHSLSYGIPHWASGCGFQSQIDLDYSEFSTDPKFKVQSLSMVAGIGTHIDAPAHCCRGGLAIADIPLKSLIVPCHVIDVSEKAHADYQIGVDEIKHFENEYGPIQKDSLVIFYTGWEKWWHQPSKYKNEFNFPSITEKAAEYLLTQGIIGLGIDTLSPDRTDSGYPVHRLLLGAGKYIIENIANAKEIGANGFIIGLPIKITEGTEAPMRLVGLRRN